MTLTRRTMLMLLSATPMIGLAQGVTAQARLIWTAPDTLAALRADAIRLVDVRSREEWQETGLAEGAWPISLHEKRFENRLFAARDLAGDRDIALICATGGRTAAIMRALRRAKYTGFIDVSEGMLGSRAGPGWIATGLPIVSMDQALERLPDALA